MDSKALAESSWDLWSHGTSGLPSHHGKAMMCHRAHPQVCGDDILWSKPWKGKKSENRIAYKKEQLGPALKHLFGMDSLQISKRRKAPSPLAGIH